MKKHKQSSIESYEITGRLLPQAVEFEELIIAAVISERQSFQIAQEIISSEMFYAKTNEIIYRAVESLYDENKPIDLPSVYEQLRKSGKIEQIGGATFLAQLSQKFIGSHNFEYQCRIVLQKYIARKAIEYLSESVNNCFDESKDIDETLSEVGLKIEKLQESAFGKSDFKLLRDVMKKSLSEMKERIEKRKEGLQSGINTGLADLNRITGGWQKSNLIIVAGRPSMGKTAIALHFAKSAAKKGNAVLIFELEMSDVKLSDRLLLSESNTDPNDYKVGKLVENNEKDIELAYSKLYSAKIHIDNNPVVTIDYIRNRSRMMKNKGLCDIVIIDYLQLIEDSGNKNSIREQEVAKISRKAKLLAKELDIPVILLAQLNRGVESRNCKKPMLSDLRESGAIEQDADMVIFIYRDEYYNENSDKGKGNLIIAKYRDGYTGEIDFAYNESMTKIFDTYFKEYEPF